MVDVDSTSAKHGRSKQTPAPGIKHTFQAELKTGREVSSAEIPRQLYVDSYLEAVRFLPETCP